MNFNVGTYTKPQKQSWGTSMYFKDPDGNQFALIQPNTLGKALTAASAPTT